jgi:hypothetical protein
LGIEVWISYPIEIGDYEYEVDTEPPLRYRKAVYLGYAQVDDQWQLAIEEVSLETKDNGFEEATNPEVSSLSSASRGLRIAAMDTLPKVLDELKGKAESLNNSIDAGKKAAESL